MTEKKEIDLGRLEATVKGLRKLIRLYFRSILTFFVLVIFLAVMIPSWRRPWGPGYIILAFSMSILPLSVVIFLHFAVFFKVIAYCIASKKNSFLTFLYPLISLAVPLGAFFIAALLFYDSKRTRIRLL